MTTTTPKGMNIFERYLSLWVAAKRSVAIHLAYICGYASIVIHPRRRIWKEALRP